MKRCACLIAALGLALGGCALQTKQSPSDRSPVMENARDYDAYVERRTDDLMRMGATKNRSDASTLAEDEAERRFGPRTPTDAASWSWMTGKNTNPTSDQLDAALGKNR